VIDTFPAFVAFWESVQGQSIDTQIERWASEYMASWPELLDKQRASYAHEGFDWCGVARDRVLPFLGERLPAMIAAHDLLLKICPQVGRRIHRTLGLYVGIGCGAGWASSFDGRPAVLLGLEMIAECGWEHVPTLEGLVAHEAGHLVHTAWRRDAGVATASGPWWQLYTEGFAQYCEHVILGRETWHEAAGIWPRCTTRSL
jgi:hypothetical protein